jgi:hypothetical protein
MKVVCIIQRYIASGQSIMIVIEGFTDRNLKET